MVNDERGWAFITLYPGWNGFCQELDKFLYAIRDLIDDTEVFHDPEELAFRRATWDEWLRRYGFDEDEFDESDETAIRVSRCESTEEPEQENCNNDDLVPEGDEDEENDEDDDDDEDDEGELDPTNLPLPHIPTAVESACEHLSRIRENLWAIENVLPNDIREAIANQLQLVQPLLDESALTQSNWASQVNELREHASCLSKTSEELFWFIHSLKNVVFGSWGAWFFQCAFEAKTELADEYHQFSIAKATEILLPHIQEPRKTDWRTKKEARDRWVYEMMMSKMTLKRILTELQRNPHGWASVQNVQAIRPIAQSYADKHDLPRPPQRPRGRPTGS